MRKHKKGPLLQIEMGVLQLVSKSRNQSCDVWATLGCAYLACVVPQMLVVGVNSSMMGQPSRMVVLWEGEFGMLGPIVLGEWKFQVWIDFRPLLATIHLKPWMLNLKQIRYSFWWGIRLGCVKSLSLIELSSWWETRSSRNFKRKLSDKVSFFVWLAYENLIHKRWSAVGGFMSRLQATSIQSPSIYDVRFEMPRPLLLG